MDNAILKKESICRSCNKTRSSSNFDFAKDKCACRCYSSKCPMKKAYISVRTGSFFEKFMISLRGILKIILKYAARQPIYFVKAL